MTTDTVKVGREPYQLQHGLPAARDWDRRSGLAVVPVASILLMQALLSIRMLHTSAASGDEALYIYSGHQLIHELWHGGGSPYYETYFSGAPVIYPVLAAMADRLGGLTLIRLVSGVFMLAATGLLYVTARRIFGYWPAVIAAALFASLGITQGLGAYATFDALALMLIAFAAYCATRAVDSSRWLIAIPACSCWPTRPSTPPSSSTHRDPARRTAAAPGRAGAGVVPGGRTGGTTILLLAVVVLLAGTAYLNGILLHHPGQEDRHRNPEPESSHAAHDPDFHLEIDRAGPGLCRTGGNSGGQRRPRACRAAFARALPDGGNHRYAGRGSPA